MDTASSTPSAGDSSVPVGTEAYVPPAPPVAPPTALPQVHDFALPPQHELGKKNASYGALISIIIILAIVVVGAFYSWGERIEKNNVPPVINEVPGVTATTTP